MSLIVLKYGGTSVGSPEKIKAAAATIKSLKQSGHSLVVVVSAMGHTTDELLALAQQVSPHPAPRELDMLLTAGERISMALVSMALTDLGVASISFTGSQAGIITDESHTSAHIIEIRPLRVKEELAQGRVVIIAGFQGVSRTREVTTLGRGGSDTTAVAMAVALKADRCEILTDVKGVYSADPRVVPKAQHYKILPLEVVYELAQGGAQVMHERSIKAALDGGLSLYVGHAADRTQGTHLVPLTAVPSDAPASVPVPGTVLCAASKGQCITLAGVALGAQEHVRKAAQRALDALGHSQACLTPLQHSIKIDLSSCNVDDKDVRAALIALHDQFIVGGSGP